MANESRPPPPSLLDNKYLIFSRLKDEFQAGIIIGPTVLGTVKWVASNVTPFEGGYFLETMSNLGVTFYMFLVGLEMDLAPIRKIGKTALSVAIAGILVPLGVGAGIFLMLYKTATPRDTPPPFIGIFFWSIALSVTSFPDLARMLSDLKLMYTDLGKTALSAAVVSDLCSWFLLVVTVSLVNGHRKLHVALPILAGMTLFWFLIRPMISWVVKQSKDASREGKYSEIHVSFIVSAVLLCGYLTELCGAHSMFGAFMFGLMIPSGELGTLIMETIEDFVVGILLPPSFIVIGMRTNLVFVAQFNTLIVVLLMLLSFSAKIISTLLVCLYFRCPTRDSFALGLLMNTKGVLVLIVLNEGRGMKAFDQPTFTLAMLAILVMTAIVGPVIHFTHKSNRNLKQFYHRNLERSRPEAALRVLTCLHSTKNLSGMINLLHISNATRKSPIVVFAVHLVELAGRNTAMLIFHDKDKTGECHDIGNNATREKAEAQQIVTSFESFEEDNHAVTVQPLTAVSPYATMHEDVSTFADDKLANIILIPFHKHPNALGGWVDENLQHRELNQNLLANAPCTIALLVDRGLTSPLYMESHSGGAGVRQCHVAMLFVGGPDDREALAYAWRMAGTPRVTLTVVRFLPGKDVCELPERDDDDLEDGILTAMYERERDKQLDDEYIYEFRFKTMNDQSVAYIEKIINSGEEIVSTLNSAYSNFDLFIVGRGDGVESPLTIGLSSFSEYPELGALGETMVSLSSESRSPAPSVLVVQQSAPAVSGSKKFKNNNSAPSSQGKGKGVFGKTASSAVETFVNHRKADDEYN
ncbi:Cation/H+ exchanger [Corchorus olitorius]|uniref:Cation/H+ exchanger n=1 Tax=Corchorus olitorius TaxID=93759 RepID=A0A1R3HX16_9ROSI|nr:Cation/H+ exchanger [Corchorus olitorius]